MRRFLLNRLAMMLVVLLAMTLVVFLLRQVVPSDPARAAVGPNAPPSAVEAARHVLGLDQPVYAQYINYLGQLLHGNLGTSTRTLNPVASDIAVYLPASLELIIFAILIAVAFAFALAFGQTLFKHSGFLRVLLLSGASAPIFLTAQPLLLLLWFKLGWLPSGGRTQ